jgi:hypothetical protein
MQYFKLTNSELHPNDDTDVLTMQRTPGKLDQKYDLSKLF